MQLRRVRVRLEPTQKGSQGSPGLRGSQRCWPLRVVGEKMGSHRCSSAVSRRSPVRVHGGRLCPRVVGSLGSSQLCVLRFRASLSPGEIALC